MARLESREKMGFLVMEARHHEAIFSLLEARKDKDARILDPFAGEGVFLEAAAKAWNLNPYANELEPKRAEECRRRFGASNVAVGDAVRLSASNQAFSVLWINPPYDKNTQEKDRTELLMLKHSLKWARDNAIVFWAVYKQHLTDKACQFLSKQLSQIQIWGLPGKHLNEYDQVLVTGLFRRNPNHENRYAELLIERHNPRPLSKLENPVYQIPPVSNHNRFSFSSDILDPDQAFALSQQSGASHTPSLAELLNRRVKKQDRIKPVVLPRPGHTALVLGTGITNGTILETEKGRSAVRGKMHLIEEVARIITEPDPKNPEYDITHTHLRRRPLATINLLGENGDITTLQGDDGILKFVQDHQKSLAAYLNKSFAPLYNFDYRTRDQNLAPYLNSVRVMGKYPLYNAQKHAIAAIARGLEEKRGIFLSGQMGVGKTSLGSTAITLLSGNIIKQFQSKMKDDQISLIICPPHLLDKWRRELHAIYPDIYFKACTRHEEIHSFMDQVDSAKNLLKAFNARILSLYVSHNTRLKIDKLLRLLLHIHILAKAIAKTPKVMLIKRDMTKLGCIHEAAVVMKKVYGVRWKKDEEPPKGYTQADRLYSKVMPSCPHCGEIAMTKSDDEENEEENVLSLSELSNGKQHCYSCGQALWQETRTEHEMPKAGEKFPSKAARYRLDKYIAKAYRHRIYLLVWDEVHEAQRADRGNGEAFSRLASISNKILVGTGTPFNGKSSSTFNFEYHLNPRVRKAYPWGGAYRTKKKVRGYKLAHGERYYYYNQHYFPSGNTRGHSESAWVRDMGIREKIIEDRPEYDSDTGVYTGTSTYERPYTEANGINPRLVAEMLDHSIYISLQDLGIKLPDYEEITVPVQMDSDIAETYKSIHEELLSYMKARFKDGDVSFRGAYLEWARGWPNRPEKPCDIIHNIKDPNTRRKHKHVVASIPAFNENRVFNKEQQLLDILNQELAEGRPCIVYVRQTITNDIRPRLEKLIKQHVPNAKPYSLPSSVSAERREARINREIAAGNNILITAPQLVATGLDLLHYKNIIWYESTYDLRIFSQAGSRTLRANSDSSIPLKTYFLFWEGTMEHRAIQLMSRKQRAAKLLTGDIGLSGLDELTADESNFEEGLVNAMLNGSEELNDPRKAFTREVEVDAITEADLAYWAQNEGLEDYAKHETPSPYQVLRNLYEKDNYMFALITALPGEKQTLPMPLEMQTAGTTTTSLAATLSAGSVGTVSPAKPNTMTTVSKSSKTTRSKPSSTATKPQAKPADPGPLPSFFTTEVSLGQQSIRRMPVISPKRPEPEIKAAKPDNPVISKSTLSPTEVISLLQSSISKLPTTNIFPKNELATIVITQAETKTIQALITKLRESVHRLQANPIFTEKERGSMENEPFKDFIQRLSNSRQKLPTTSIWQDKDKSKSKPVPKSKQPTAELAGERAIV